MEDVNGAIGAGGAAVAAGTCRDAAANMGACGGSPAAPDAKSVIDKVKTVIEKQMYFIFRPRTSPPADL
jgi:hypothetical protein